MPAFAEVTHIASSDELCCMHSARLQYAYWKGKTLEAMGSVTVPAVSVEQLLAENPTVHFVKIDIEGAELELLETVVWYATPPPPPPPLSFAQPGLLKRAHPFVCA
eukprot:SAG11_NODE_1904_length_4088_cov_3.427676_4_plen_106_part_00